MTFAQDKPLAEGRKTMNGKPVFTVPAKAVINFKSGFAAKLLCDGLTFSTGSACVYSCAFCYVETMMTKNPHWQAIKADAPDGKFENVVIRRAGALEAMRQQLTDRHGKAKFNDPEDRRVIFSSPLVDVAGNLDLVAETIEACQLILELTNWQIRLLSKSNFLPRIAKGLAIMDQGTRAKERVIYGVSTGTLDDDLARSFEQGTPKPSKRIESLHWLQDNGFRTYGMLCPSLPLPSKDYHAMAADMANAIRSHKCEAVWTEVINVRGESMTRTCAGLRAGGYDAHADALEKVSTDKAAWEQYARHTFDGHAKAYDGDKATDHIGGPKLRTLHYVTVASKKFWTRQIPFGAVML